MSDEINVIIHGFGGSTKEIMYLKEYLDGNGLAIQTITLAGHGGTKKDLHKTSHKNWLESAEAEIAKLSTQYGKINLIGFSMGGLISANIALSQKINKLVFVNTPIYFWNLKLIAKRVFTDLRSGGNENIAYFRKSVGGVSIKSAIEFLRILSKTKKILNTLQTQSLILQCTEDETVHYKSAEYLKSKLKNTRLKYYEGGHHQIFLKAIDLRDEFCGEILNFLR